MVSAIVFSSPVAHEESANSATRWSSVTALQVESGTVDPAPWVTNPGESLNAPGASQRASAGSIRVGKALLMCPSALCDPSLRAIQLSGKGAPMVSDCGIPATTPETGGGARGITCTQITPTGYPC